MASTLFPTPQSGASLVLAFKLTSSSILIIGSSHVAAARAFAALEADSQVVILGNRGLKAACPEIQHRANVGEITFFDLDSLLNKHLSFTGVLDHVMDNHPRISLACVTDTLLTREGSSIRSFTSAREIYVACQKKRIPVNTTDIPDLCDYTFPATHRFPTLNNQRKSPLQVSITTNGQGCRLAGRLKRDIIAHLPPNVGQAVVTISKLRELAKDSDLQVSTDSPRSDFRDLINSPTPNLPVRQLWDGDSPNDTISRRMQWVAQLSEFWPLKRLSELNESDIRNVLSQRGETEDGSSPRQGHSLEGRQSGAAESQHSLSLPDRKKRQSPIFLVGSGTGHPSLLTIAAHELLTKRATLVLSDKLVPSSILEIIPKHIPVIIARKFPGNADDAQSELMDQAVEAASRDGSLVVRLKQGDPMVYGRAGEEILFFRKRGFETVVIPGVSSVFGGPSFAGIPVTQRGVSESVVICTGVGRQGKEVSIPGYRRERTTIILMGMARLREVLGVLLDATSERRHGAVYPHHLPVAVIERASMPDQRVVMCTLGSLDEAFNAIGSQRPPGMIIVGWSVLALDGDGDTGVLDVGAEELDTLRVAKWLGASTSKVMEGLLQPWDAW